MHNCRERNSMNGRFGHITGEKQTPFGLNAAFSSVILESEELFAQDARLKPAHFEFLIIGEKHSKGAARHWQDFTDRLNVDKGAAAQADKSLGPETPLKVS